MENRIDRIDPRAEIEALQEQTPTAQVEVDLREDPLPPLIATTLAQEIVPPGADYRHTTARLRETIIEQDPHLEQEVPQGDILHKGTMIGESGLGLREMTGKKLALRIRRALLIQYRRRSRSPYDRDRTTTRARSPIQRRSPPSGPRGSYRAYSRSPDRRDDRIPTGPSNRRHRSPTPPHRDSERSSARTSGSNSRRSSPHVHPSRLTAVQQASRPRTPPLTRERSPPAQLAYRDRSAARSTPRERSPVRPRSPPRGPATFRPPTGPGGTRNITAPSPSPTMPTNSAPMSISARNRAETGPIVPPAGPRSQFTPSRGGYVGRGGRGSFGHDRQTRPDWGAAPSRPANDLTSRPVRPVDPVTRPPPASPAIPKGPSSTSVPTGPSAGIPTGPRASAGIPSRPNLQHSSSIYGGRSQSISSGPRPHPAMANVPQIIPGGKIDPTASGMSTETASRVKKREDEAEVLRAELEAKQDSLRKNLKEYERMKSDSAQWALRSELSERHVRTLAGEGVGGAAF